MLFRSGKSGEKVVLIDEVHTPDSSRYFYKDGYEERQKQGVAQKQLSKEFVRQWLIDNGFQGKDGQRVPEMTDQIVEGISARYRELFTAVTGQQLTPLNSSNRMEEIRERIESYLKV